jgi:hypothetical protein
VAGKKTFSQQDLQRLRAYLDELPSVKIDKFRDLGPGLSIKDQLYKALHDESLTLTDIKNFLDRSGYATTVDKLRQMRRVMFTLDIDAPEDADPKKTIRLDRMRVKTWIAKKSG